MKNPFKLATYTLPLDLTTQELLIKTFNTVSQLSHFGWGCMVMFGTEFFGKKLLIDIIAFLVWVTYSAIKEFIFDQNDEVPVIRGSNLLDFTVQAGSSLITLIIIYFVKYH